MVYYNDDRMKLLAYNKTAVVLWGAVQHLVSEKDELLEMVKSMKKEILTMKGEITKLKKKKIKDTSPEVRVFHDALPEARELRDDA